MKKNKDKEQAAPRPEAARPPESAPASSPAQAPTPPPASPAPPPAADHAPSAHGPAEAPPPHSGGFAGALAHGFIDSKLTPLLVLVSILLGLFAVFMTPREEEPQISVPMIDVLVAMPGASVEDVEKRIINPMEKLLAEIPGVEYVYSTAMPERAMTILRFKVGEDADRSVIKVMEKLEHHKDRIPPGVHGPFVKARSIDDVPILALTLHGREAGPFDLRRMAAQLVEEIKSVTDVSTVELIGGARREVRVEFDPNRLAGFRVSPSELVGVIGDGNLRTLGETMKEGDTEFAVTLGGHFKSIDEVKRLVVRAQGKRPIYLEELATVTDDTAEPSDYVMFRRGNGTNAKRPAAASASAAADPDPFEHAVTIAISKRRGTNATDIAHEVLRKVETTRGKVLPSGVEVTVTRNYGETAKEKSDELLYHMALATISVTLLIWAFLGFRASVIVAIAIPVTLALTLLSFYLVGYTLNRITLFALIFSIGILVDDAIVVVENMVRHFAMGRNRGRNFSAVAVESVAEVGNPTVLATIAVIVAILPMAFVSGLMGPYMRPIPVGASAAMIFSLLVAFLVTPWAALRILNLRETAAHAHDHAPDDLLTRLYHRVMEPMLHDARHRRNFLIGVVALLLLAVAMVGFGLVRVKMLPFDNKSEFQVIVDMPEGTTLERTAAALRDLADYLATVPEVDHTILHAGTAAPYNFNGLVRHYFMRDASHEGDLQVNLAPKGDRKRSSHQIATEVRPRIHEIAARYGANVKVAEVPPGPPVLQTLVAEIYGPDLDSVRALTNEIAGRLRKTDGVVDVDTYVEEPRPRRAFAVDREKAALNGLSHGEVVDAMRLALSGREAGLMHFPGELEDVRIRVTPPDSRRASVHDLLNVHAVSRHTGKATPLSELARVTETADGPNIYHKNLKQVAYVVADVGGSEESPVYPILRLVRELRDVKTPAGALTQYTFTTQIPQDTSLGYFLKWDGEWHITVEVFRDLGLAFAVAMLLIYMLVVGWFQSFKTPLVIMAPIPLTLIGILPAHWAMGAFFTATSMIGFIAGAGIIVRNSIILVDFIQLKVAEGMPLDVAVVEAGSIRFRPMLLTASAVVVGSAVMLFDPIFQGLAIALMAGEIASTLLSRFTVPILYYMSEKK